MIQQYLVLYLLGNEIEEYLELYIQDILNQKLYHYKLRNKVLLVLLVKHFPKKSSTIKWSLFNISFTL